MDLHRYYYNFHCFKDFAESLRIQLHTNKLALKIFLLEFGYQMKIDHGFLQYNRVVKRHNRFLLFGIMMTKRLPLVDCAPFLEKLGSRLDGWNF